MSAAVAEADGEYTIGGGSSGPSAPAGPRFQDPFAQSRADRSNGGRPRRKQQGKKGKGKGKGQQEPSKGRGLMLVIVAGVLVGGLGFGAYSAISAQQERVAQQESAAQAARQAQLKAQQDKIQQGVTENLEEKVNEAIQESLELEKDEPIGIPEEDILIPIGGPDRRSVRNQGGGSTQGGVPSGGTMTTAATTPADHYDAGRSALSSGDPSGAARAFRMAVQGDPTNGTYREYLGLALMNAGASDAASEFTAATNYGSKRAYVYLGDLAFQQGDTAGAIGYWQQYLALVPGDASVQAKIDGAL